MTVTPATRPNRAAIEDSLLDFVKKSDPRLLGELDLHNINEELGDSPLRLATHVCEQLFKLEDPIKSLNTRNYWASLSIWIVGHAQLYGEGSDFWGTLHPGKINSVRVGKLFESYLSEMGLPIFEDYFTGKHRYVGLARLHAIVPQYAAERFMGYIHQAKNRGWGAQALLANLRSASDLHDAVASLLKTDPIASRDLIERLALALEDPQYEDLVPPHLRVSLGAISRRNLKLLTPQGGARADNAQPSIEVDPDGGRVFCTLPASPFGWAIKRGGSEEVVQPGMERVFDIPHGGLSVQRGDWSEPSVFLEPADRYWIFGAQHVLGGRAIPKTGAYMIAPAGAAITPHSQIALRYGEMSGSWGAHELFIVKPAVDLSVSHNLDAFRVPAEQGISVNSEPLKGIYTAEGGSVWSEAPCVIKGSFYKHDHLGQKPLRKITGPCPLVGDKLFALNVTLRASLGAGHHFSGIVAPGLTLTGAENAILPDEKREFHLEAPSGWKGSLTGQLDAFSPSIEHTLTDPSGDAHALIISPGLVAWAVRKKGVTSAWDNRAIVITHQELQEVEEVWIRTGSSERIQIFTQVDQELGPRFEGDSNLGLSVVDIRQARTLSLVNPKSVITFTASIQGKAFNVLKVQESLSAPRGHVPKNKMQTVSLLEIPRLLGWTEDQMTKARQENDLELAETNRRQLILSTNIKKGQAKNAWF